MTDKCLAVYGRECIIQSKNLLYRYQPVTALEKMFKNKNIEKLHVRVQ